MIKTPKKLGLPAVSPKGTPIDQLFQSWHSQTVAISEPWHRIAEMTVPKRQDGRTKQGFRREAEFHQKGRQKHLARRLSAVSGRASRVMQRLYDIQHAHKFSQENMPPCLDTTI